MSTVTAKYRICIIAIYLGRLPGWLPVWLRSCELNPRFDFLLVTDRPEDVPFAPSNLRVQRATLSELRERFCQGVGFSVSLNHAFKICDFRPSFGVSFADLLTGYDFWGHTDVDMFYGNLAHFICEPDLDQFVRLYHRGHLSLFRNNDEGNYLFTLSHPTVDYRQVFRTDECCHFDEYLGIEKLMRFHSVPEFENNYAFADIVPKRPSLTLTRSELNHKKQIFVYDKGSVHQIFAEGGEIRSREFMYLHIQKRKIPDVDPKIWRTLSSWVCTPQGFLPLARDTWTEADLIRFNKPNYAHALSYAWKRALRRLDSKATQKSS